MDIFRTPLNYGSIAGLISFGIFLLIYVMGKNPLGNMSLLGIWVPVVFIYLGIKKHRDTFFKGYISFGQAFGQGALTSFIYASLFAILVYIFGIFVDDTIVDLFITEAIQAMDQVSGMLSEEMYNEMYDKFIEELEGITLSAISLSEFRSKLIWGIIISLVVAAFLKKKKSVFEEEEVNE
jgi:hypothetical protein